jgi:hypothetical protein
MLLVAAACGVGCEPSADVAEPMVPAARMTTPASERAIEAISSARCDHEQRCNSIGPTARYMTRDHCMSVMRSDGYDGLGVCRLGIDQEELQECLVDISNDDCNGPAARLDAKPACRANKLCMD